MIVVAGEALVDLVGDGEGLRPVPGGGPFNTALALGRLGLAVAFLGTLSSDPYGELLAESLDAAGVSMSLVFRSDAPTPLAIVREAGEGVNDYSFYLAGTALTDFAAERVRPLPEEAWAIHVGTLALASDPPAADYETLVRSAAGHRTVVFDPNVRPGVLGDPAAYRRRFERVAGLADIVKLSDQDGAWLYPGLEPADAAGRVLALGPRLVAMTLGADGALARSSQGTARIPALQVPVADTVGAGDSFGAALLAALIEHGAFGPGASGELDDRVLAAALSYAVAAAAITCTRRGAVAPTRTEIEGLLGASETLS